MNTLDEIMTVAEMLSAEKNGYNLFQLLSIIKWTDEQKKTVSGIDITSGDEKYRAGKRKKLLPEIRDDKEFDSDFGLWYVLAEIARSPSLYHLLKSRLHKDKITEFIFTACAELADKKVFTLPMLYLIITLCTKLDSDKIINSYDVDRHRGKKRAIEWIKNNM